jgi:hypothetical protein
VTKAVILPETHEYLGLMARFGMHGWTLPHCLRSLQKGAGSRELSSALRGFVSGRCALAKSPLHVVRDARFSLIEIYQIHRTELIVY